MKKKIVSVVLAGIMAVGVLSGCSNNSSAGVTAESLLKDVQKNTDALKSMAYNMDLTMTIESPVWAGSMDVSMNMEAQTTTEPEAAYIKSSTGLFGMNLDMENYTVVEDDQILTYTLSQGQWMLMKMPYSADAIEVTETVEADLLKSLDSLTLEADTENVNGAEAYIISGSVSGDDIKNLMGSVESLTGDITNGVDLSDMTVDFKYAISKEKKLPIYMDITLGDMNVDADGESVKISNMSMRMDYTGFDTIDKITVPQEVIDSAVDYTNLISNVGGADTPESIETTGK